jgi:hypothetical protein
MKTPSTIKLVSITVDAGSVLHFEGVFLFRPELNAYWDFRVRNDTLSQKQT